MSNILYASLFRGKTGVSFINESSRVKWYYVTSFRYFEPLYHVIKNVFVLCAKFRQGSLRLVCETCAWNIVFGVRSASSLPSMSKQRIFSTREKANDILPCFNSIRGSTVGCNVGNYH